MFVGADIPTVHTPGSSSPFISREQRDDIVTCKDAKCVSSLLLKQYTYNVYSIAVHRDAWNNEKSTLIVIYVMIAIILCHSLNVNYIYMCIVKIYILHYNNICMCVRV